jgi:hypothetical protein
MQSFGSMFGGGHADTPGTQQSTLPTSQPTGQPARGGPQGTPPNKEWVYCIPVMPGFPTRHALGMRRWLFGILVLQTGACALRVFFLQDIIGGLWMGLTICIGAHAYYEGPMNITYICVWGVVCLVNGLLDVIGAIIPLILGLLTFDFVTTLVRLLVPLAYVCGAFFAYHLYLDYAAEHDIKTGYAIALVPDVFVMLKSKVDHRLHPGTDEERASLNKYDQTMAVQGGAQVPTQTQQHTGGVFDAWMQGIGQSAGAAIGKGVAQGAQQEVQNQANQALRGGSPPGSGPAAGMR